LKVVQRPQTLSGFRSAERHGPSVGVKVKGARRKEEKGEEVAKLNVA
jgi:hypothetical protein